MMFLITTYGDRWIGRGKPVDSQTDFFFWGSLRSLVCATVVEKLRDLRNLIIAGCNSIKNEPAVFERV